MRKVLDVTVAFNQIHCLAQGEWSPDEPYLLTFFIKIDGTTFKISKDGFLEGTVSIYKTDSKHANLGVGGAQSGDIIIVPDNVGKLKTSLHPIPVDPEYPIGHSFLIDKAFPGLIIGVGILMEEDAFADSLITNVYDIITSELENKLNALLPTLKMSDLITDKINYQKLFDPIEEKIIDSLSFDDKVTVLVDADDVIGHVIMKYHHDELLTINKTPASTSYALEGTNGNYRLDTSVSVDAPVWCHLSEVGKVVRDFSISDWKKVNVNDYCFNNEEHEYCIKTNSVVFTFAVETFNFNLVNQYSWFLNGVLLDEKNESTDILLDTTKPDPPASEFKVAQEVVKIKYKISYDAKGSSQILGIDQRAFIVLEIENPDAGCVSLNLKAIATNTAGKSIASPGVEIYFDHQSILWDDAYNQQLIECLKNTLPVNTLTSIREKMKKWWIDPRLADDYFTARISVLEKEVIRIGDMADKINKKIGIH